MNATCVLERKKHCDTKPMHIFTKVGKYSTKLIFQCKCVFILSFHLFCNNFRRGCLRLVFGRYALAPAVLCGNFVATCTHAGANGYWYMYGNPRELCTYGYGYGWEMSYPWQACNIRRQNPTLRQPSWDKQLSMTSVYLMRKKAVKRQLISQ